MEPTNREDAPQEVSKLSQVKARHEASVSRSDCCFEVISAERYTPSSCYGWCWHGQVCDQGEQMKKMKVLAVFLCAWGANA